MGFLLGSDVYTNEKFDDITTHNNNFSRTINPTLFCFEVSVYPNVWYCSLLISIVGGRWIFDVKYLHAVIACKYYKAVDKWVLGGTMQYTEAPPKFC